MGEAARRIGDVLHRDVRFRGAFTLDGVATADGFRPTELNPRFGAGLGVITSGLGGLPLHLVLDLVVAGRDLGVSAVDLEREILAEADARRSGGSWQLDVEVPVVLDGRGACYDGAEWRWAVGDEPADGDVVAKGAFIGVMFTPERTPVGPSVGARSRGVLAVR